MNIHIIKFCVLTVMLLGLPLLGVLGSNHPITAYLKFPPTTRMVHHAPFSWPMFIGIALFILIMISPFIIQGLRHINSLPLFVSPRQPGPHPFPKWHWIGPGLIGIAWVMAWSRFSWFKTFQPHTFTPLWVGYILWINAAMQAYGMGENVASANMILNSVADVVAGWMSSPGHRANILYADFDETGIAVVESPVDGKHYFCQTFGYREGTWAGFAPFDTTDLLNYIETNFAFAGTGDEHRIPEVYLS